MSRFEDFGIYIDNTNSGEQRMLCPRCSHLRKPEHKHLKCLSVNVTKGVWFCHNCGWSGSIYGRKSMKEIEFRYVKPSLAIYEFFEKRGINSLVVDRNRITMSMRQFGNDKRLCICFNYFLDGKLYNIKFRTLSKEFQQIKNGAKIFYKLDDIKDVEECIITEGEIDALSFEVAGFINTVSVPDGGINPNVQQLAKKLSYLDNCFEYFENKKRIYLALDNDAPGVRLREELARRLGKDRCYIVRYPADCKDGNDVLVKYGSQALYNCILEAEPYPIEGVHLAKERFEELLNIYDFGFEDAAKTGYYEFDEHIRFYSGQLTIITGIPSHGKSNFLDQLMIKLSIRHGWKFGVFSPENSTIEIHLMRLAEIIVGKPFLKEYRNRMTKEELNEALQFINEHIYFILPNDEDYRLDKILEAARSLVLRYGINSLIIDPWNTIEHHLGSDSETVYIAKTLNKLKFFARNHNLHLFLVAHPRKMQKKQNSKLYEVPTLYDISGSAHWYNIADNGIVVYRQYKEDLSSSYPIVFIQKVKHKFIGRVGYVKFDFEPACQRYFEQGSVNYANELEYLKQETNYDF